MLLAVRAGDGSSTPSPGAKELIRGVIARSDAVFSGRIEYRQIVDSPRTTGVIGDATVGLSFSGDSWVRRTRETEGVELNHDGKYMEYVVHPQPDGSALHNAWVGLPRPINKNFPSPPTFAGSFWVEKTKKFVRDHAGRAVVRGQTQVNGITTVLVELPVSEKERTPAFKSFNKLTEHGGVMRLYVAPDLGYTLPRVEFVGAKEAVQSRFDAWDFKEVAPGIFFPMKMDLHKFDEQGPVSVITYDIYRVEKINEPIPDSDFVADLPKGTRVNDGRAQTHSESFRIGGPPPPGAQDLEDIIPSVTGWSYRWTWRLALLFGSGAGIGLVGLYLLWRRLRAPGGHKA